MRVLVNLPELEEDKSEFENRLADFHAKLLIERIKQYNINDKEKKKLLNMFLKHLEDKDEKCTS